MRKFDWHICMSFPHAFYKRIHWNKNVVILTKFSSLAALEVVILTTSSAASDEHFIKMKTFPFQCWCNTNGHHFVDDISNTLSLHLYFDSNFIEISFLGSNLQYVSIGLGNAFVPDKQQAIIWTKNDSIYGWKYASHCLGPKSILTPPSISGAQYNYT